MSTKRTGASGRLITVMLLLACLGAAAPGDVSAQSPSAWRAEYFDNENLTGQPLLERNESSINYEWQDSTPGDNVPADHFSVRWTAYFPFDDGQYVFRAFTDSGVRLWVDGQLLIGQWGNQALTSFERQINLTAGYHSLRMEYCHSTGKAMARLRWEKELGPLPPDRWRAEYFNGSQPTGQAVWIREESRIDHNWGINAPAPNLATDAFSVRWTGEMSFDADDSYLFTVSADDAVRVWIDGDLLIERWEGHPQSTVTAARYMGHGSHAMIVEYADKSGTAAIHFFWQRETGPTPTAVPTQPPAPKVWDPNVVPRWGGPNRSCYERSSGYKGEIYWDAALVTPALMTIKATAPSIWVTGGTLTQSTIMVTVTDAWTIPCVSKRVTYDLSPAIASLSSYRGALDGMGSHSVILTSGTISGTVWVTATVETVSRSVDVQIMASPQP